VREIKIGTRNLPFILQEAKVNLILLLAINSIFHQKDLPSKASHLVKKNKSTPSCN
jgi:hypothetical protein